MMLQHLAPRARHSRILAACVAVLALASASLTTPHQAAAAEPPSLPSGVAPLQPPLLQKDDLVAICGDSITARKIYSVYVQTYLLTAAAGQNANAMQFGWGGETAPGFLKRVENDVLRFKPTIATTCYGMNDGGYGPVRGGTVTTYKNALRDVVSKFKAAGVRTIVIGSPGVVDTKAWAGKKKDTTPEVYNNTLSELAGAARSLAETEGCRFADVHAVMADTMKRAKTAKGEDYIVAGTDGVHPTDNGHLIMAYAFLRALGCDGNVGTITVDLKAGTAEGTEGQKIAGTAPATAAAGPGVKVDIESSRYPFCFPPNKDAHSAASILEFLPFQADLNRYTLVVTNIPEGAKTLKVTWGNATRTLPVADLARGINLAEEFRNDNPLIPAFAKVMAAVREQQELEGEIVMGQLNKLMTWRKFLRDDDDDNAKDKEALAEIEILANAFTKRLNTQRQQTATLSATAAPARHSLTVEVAE
ncbi:hypothetical protein DB346_18590 [Verrucomicrobia bacterium LW23]|nr:hypothetical protein DB346_18590 [Verrucomicrobia bacterium LW23]